MSEFKFKPGQRVSFLYFGEKRKGTILERWPGPFETLWCVCIDKPKGGPVCVTEGNMKRLKPRAKRREFWVVVKKNTDLPEWEGGYRFAYYTEDAALRIARSDSDLKVMHVRECKK